MIRFTWREDLCCSICNPVRLADLECPGVKVEAPRVELWICQECLEILDAMSYVDTYDRPHHPEALQAMGEVERTPQTQVRLRRGHSRPKTNLSHRAAQTMALRHLALEFMEEGKEHGSREAAELLKECARRLLERLGLPCPASAGEESPRVSP